MDKIKAFIFDMDGTLIDSEPNYTKADCALVAHYGGYMSADEHDNYVGMGTDPFIDMIVERFKIKAPKQEIIQKHFELYLSIAKKETRVFPEMKIFLMEAIKKGYKTAIASGSSLQIINEMMDFTGLKDYFDLLVSSEEVKNGKPAPDVFLETAKRLGLNPEECCVLEDSRFGMEAALNAGMKLIAIPGSHIEKPQEYILPAAHIKFSNMSAFSSEALWTHFNI